MAANSDYVGITNQGESNIAQPQHSVNVAIVQPPIEVIEPADEGIWYWLACICCNGCGFGTIALILHLVALSIWEVRGGNNSKNSQSLWRKARTFRNIAIGIGIVVLIVYLIMIIAFSRH
eukprot:UN08964